MAGGCVPVGRILGFTRALGIAWVFARMCARGLGRHARIIARGPAVARGCVPGGRVLGFTRALGIAWVFARVCARGCFRKCVCHFGARLGGALWRPLRAPVGRVLGFLRALFWVTWSRLRECVRAGGGACVLIEFDGAGV